MILDDLKNESKDVESLQLYLSGNFDQIYDFFICKKHSELLALRDSLNAYIQLNRNVILSVNADKNLHLTFISLLLDICEELGLVGSFRFLYEHLISKDYNIGERLRAASFYLIGITEIDDYLNRYNKIYDHLQNSSLTEEDNTDRVLMTMVNYYAQVINDFGEFSKDKVLELREKIQKSLSESTSSFLNSQLISDVLRVELDNFTDAYGKIHSLLDSFLGRDIVKPHYKKEYLLETGTEYCELLTHVENKFYAIRQISVKKYQAIKSNSIFDSLGRGVAILTDENQLYAYMNSYGNMHYEKLIDAFKKLPKSAFENVANIIDWGCGQAMATMTYFEFQDQIRAKKEIKNITLIEPSEIALKRATLHVKKFSPSAEVYTVNKDLDALSDNDFISKGKHNHIHLFSNILDIDHFSLSKLLRLVELNFSGDNYFICVSPYVNDTRTNRLDAFVRYFTRKDSFSMIDSIDNKSGQWKSDWTRVVRIFKVTL